MDIRETVERIKLLENDPKEAVMMLLSACADTGSEEGCLISVKAFPKTADAILMYFAERT